MPRGKPITLNQLNQINHDLAKPGATRKMVAEKHGLSEATVERIDIVRRNAKEYWTHPSLRES
jgi:hypothetical protein